MKNTRHDCYSFDEEITIGKFDIDAMIETERKSLDM